MTHDTPFLYYSNYSNKPIFLCYSNNNIIILFSLPVKGFYNLEACREAVTLYFTQYRHGHSAYGFVPLLTAPSQMLTASSHSNNQTIAGGGSDGGSSSSSSSSSSNENGEQTAKKQRTEEDTTTTTATTATTDHLPIVDDKKNLLPPSPTAPPPPPTTTTPAPPPPPTAANDTNTLPLTQPEQKPSQEQLVTAFLRYVDFGKLLLDLWKFHVRLVLFI